MQTIWQQHNWLKNNNSIKRHATALSLSVVVLALLLLIPINQSLQQGTEKTRISVELVKPKTVQIEPIKKPIEPQKVQIDAIKPKPETIKEPPKPKEKSKPLLAKKEQNQQNQQKNKIEKNQNKLPSVGLILNSMQGKAKLYNLDKAFQPRTANPEDFIYKTYQQPKWNQVTKLIDEEVDKPQYEMNFYSEGIEGSVERFMDKITKKKRFTTKYGTKIDCVSVAIVITACGWK